MTHEQFLSREERLERADVDEDALARLGLGLSLPTR
jgi:hypothetical protein